MATRKPYHRPAVDETRAARQPFVPVSFVEATSGRKRPHWAVSAAAFLGKLLFLCFCVLVGFTTFCVGFHWLTLPR